MGPLGFLGTLFGGPVGGGIGEAIAQGFQDNGVTATSSTTGADFEGVNYVQGINYGNTNYLPLAVAGVAVAYLLLRK